MAAVPVIDIAAFAEGDAATQARVRRQVDQACRDTGFLIVTGHGVSPGLLDTVRGIAAEFFARPVAQKRQYSMRWLDSRGWEGADRSSLAETSASEADAEKAPDLRESFGLGPLAAVPDMSEREAPFFRDNIWPDEPAQMRPVFEAYYREMEALSARILALFAAALGLPRNYFADKNDRHLSHLVINHYPAQEAPPKPNQIRAGAHTDFGDFTILYPDAKIGGLQVRDRDGVWRDVAAPPAAFIVNLGDLMAQWTNGHWVSSLHRVVNPPPELRRRFRQSVVFFHQPNWHAEIRALPGYAAEGEKFLPTTSGAHYEMKLSMLTRAPRIAATEAS